MSPERLYVVVDSTLAPGLQMAQAIHAKDEFTHAHPTTERAWRAASNTISVLAARNEDHLVDLIGEANALDVEHAVFREPDLADRVTAVAIAPGRVSQRIVRGLKPALA